MQCGNVHADLSKIKKRTMFPSQIHRRWRRVSAEREAAAGKVVPANAGGRDALMRSRPLVESVNMISHLEPVERALLPFAVALGLAGVLWLILVGLTGLLGRLEDPRPRRQPGDVNSAWPVDIGRQMLILGLQLVVQRLDQIAHTHHPDQHSVVDHRHSYRAI